MGCGGEGISFFNLKNFAFLKLPLRLQNVAFLHISVYFIFFNAKKAEKTNLFSV